MQDPAPISVFGLSPVIFTKLTQLTEIDYIFLSARKVGVLVKRREEFMDKKNSLFSTRRIKYPALIFSLFAYFTAQIVNAEECEDYFGKFVTAIHVDPEKPDNIYIAGKRPLVSNDGGDTWLKSVTTFDGGIGTSFDVAGDTVYMTWYYRGVYRSTNGGRTWIKILDANSPTQIKVSERNDAVLYVASDYEGVFKSIDSGNSWNNVFSPSELAALGTELSTSFGLTSNASNDILYLGTAYPGKIFKSTNGGDSWVEPASVIDWGQYVYSISPHSYSSDLVFASSDLGLYRSTDSAVSWVSVQDVLGNPTSYVSAPNGMTPNLNEVYFRSPPHMFKSEDGGKTVERLMDPQSAEVFYKSSFDVRTIPNGHIIYAGMEPNNSDLPPGYCQHLWRSFDDGLNWEIISSIPTDFEIDALPVAPIIDLILSD